MEVIRLTRNIKRVTFNLPVTKKNNPLVVISQLGEMELKTMLHVQCLGVMRNYSTSLQSKVYHRILYISVDKF